MIVPLNELEAAAAAVRAASAAERVAFETCRPLHGQERNEAYRVWREAQRATFAAAADLFVLTRRQRRDHA